MKVSIETEKPIEYPLTWDDIKNTQGVYESQETGSGSYNTGYIVIGDTSDDPRDTSGDRTRFSIRPHNNRLQILSSRESIVLKRRSRKYRRLQNTKITIEV